MSPQMFQRPSFTLKSRIAFGRFKTRPTPTPRPPHVIHNILGVDPSKTPINSVFGLASGCGL